jgi:hypothetical protein
MKANNTAINTDTVDATGKINGALTFNGTTNERNVELPFLYAFNRADSFSVEAWIQTSGTGEQNIISNYNNNNPGGWIFQVDGDDISFYFIRNGSFGSTDWIPRETVAAGVNDGSWWHVVATYSGNAASSGINLYASKTTSISLATMDSNSNTLASDPTTEYKCTIGARTRVGDIREQEFTGLIDNVRIYDRVLTPTEIEGLHNGGDGTEALTGSTGGIMTPRSGYWGDI